MTSLHPGLRQAIALSQAGKGAEAVLIVNRLALEGDAGALAMLAEMKWRGGLVTPDPIAARNLWQRASEAGHKGAAAVLTNLLASGIAGPRDWPRALKRLKDEARTDPARRAMLSLLREMKLDGMGDPVSVPAGKALSDSPKVSLFSRLFTPTECAFLLKTAEPLYGPSTVNDGKGNTVRDTIRTSDGATIHWAIENPAIHALNRRLAAVSGSKAEDGEALQVLRYRPGEQYRAHFDFVRASENQRRLTALVWLNDDYEGGETCFLRSGLQVKGRKGDCLLFANSLPDRSRDDMAEHAGLPVTRGTKYLLSRWIREERWAP